MKTKRCILTFILFSLIFYVLPVDAHDPGLLIDTARSDKNGKYNLANEADKRLIECQSLMALLALKYDLKQAEIQNGTQVLLSDVFTGAIAVAVTATTGGAAAPVMVPTALSSLVKSLGLAASINSEVGVLSAYETAIDETISQIETTRTAVTNYEKSWNAYDTLVRTHNDAGPHKNSKSGDHPIDIFIPMDPNYNLPSYPCGGSCNESFPKPTSPHKAPCMHEHAVYDMVKRAKIGIPSPAYWQCPNDPSPDRCPKYLKHVKQCPGVCDEYNVINIAKTTSNVIELHQVDCKEQVYRDLSNLWLFTECPGTYYSCAGVSTCTSASKHVNGNDETAQNPQTPVDNSPNCDSCTGSCSACTQPTTPSMHPCGVHATSESGDHSLQASCSLSNNWMRTCTVTNFYACQTHTCVFPTFQCGRAACTQAVADPNEHRRNCINGHNYWSCNTGPNGVEYHKTRTCTRRKVLYRKWIRHLGTYKGIWGVCNESWANCDRRSCMDVYRAVRDHEE